MSRSSLLFRAGSIGLVLLGATGRSDAQCPTGGTAVGASPQARIGVVATPDPLCPKDVPCASAKDAIIYLKLPSIHSYNGKASAEYTADGLYSFMTIFHSATAKGMENAAIRAFNASRACPDGKACDQPGQPAAPGGQVSIMSEPATAAAPMPASPPKPPAGATAAAGAEAAGTEPTLQPIRVTAEPKPQMLPPQEKPAAPAAPAETPAAGTAPAAPK